MDKITTSDISAGIKVMAFAIPIIVSSVVAFVSISFSGGQTVEKIHQLEEELEDTIEVKEQTAIDVAVMKNEMQNLKNNFDTFKVQYQEDVKDLKELIRRNP
jgi:hypothetical protein